MNRATVPLLRCPKCHGEDLRLEAYAEDGQQVTEGTLTCAGCAEWYRLEGGIADLMPADARDIERTAAFARRHGLPTALRLASAQSVNLREQLEHFSKYVDEYDRKVVESPYHRVHDIVYFDPWLARNLRPGDLVLEIGCGTGRQTVPLVTRGYRSIGVDVSEVMAQRALHKIAQRGAEEHVDFVLGSAEDPPVCRDRFAACLIHGTIHHVDDPRAALREAAACLRPDGRIFLVDNHKSPLRPIFDWVMRHAPLYEEHAHADAKFTEGQLREWLGEAGVQTRTRLSTFLPPHLWYIIGRTPGVWLLRLSDAIERVPLVRRLGGIVVLEGRRARSATPPTQI